MLLNALQNIFQALQLPRHNVIITMISFNFFSCHSQNFHIAPQYDAVMPFKNGIAAAKQNSLWGIIDTDGHWIFKPRFTVANITADAEYIVEEPEVEFIEILQRDKNNTWVLNPYYYKREEYPTSHGIRVIDQTNNKFAIYDTNGKQLTEVIYDLITYIGQDLFIGNKMDKGDQLISADGKPITGFYSEILHDIVFGRIKFKQGQYSGIISTKGKVIVKPTWWLLELAGKNIACTIGGDLKLYSDNLEPLSDFKFNQVLNFENGNWLARNTTTGESKLFNPEGKVIEGNLEFGDGGVSKGMIPAGNKNKEWGYVNTYGKTVIPFTYKYAETFLPSGYAIVWRDANGSNKKVLIDTAGKEIAMPPFHTLEWHPNGVYYLIYKDKNQLLDKNFNPITELTKTPIAYIGQGVYIKYKVSKSLSMQKGNFYTGAKTQIFWSRDVEWSSMHSIDGALLVDKKDYDGMDFIPAVSEGFAPAKKGDKWGFIKCTKFLPNN
jgi:hypothetical protein